MRPLGQRRLQTYNGQSALAILLTANSHLTGLVRSSAALLMLPFLVAPGRALTVNRQDGASDHGRFRLLPLPRDPALLRREFTAEQLAVLERLNRRDLEHLARHDPPVSGLVVPTSWPAADDVKALSPFPETFEWARNYSKVIVVHQPWQAFGAYESGVLVRWGPVSTGRKETRTPSGLFHLTWRSKGRHSTDNAAWFLPWYFNFHNERGVSFHQFALPGYPASHACVRLLERDAIWLYGWGGQWTLDESKRHVVTPGTPVLIMGEYSYGSPPPWVDLEALSRRLILESPDDRKASTMCRH